MAEVICDNDRSASRYATKDRPGFERLCRIVTPGDVMVVWEASRVPRDMGTLIALRGLCIGEPVPSIAEAFKVRRATLYRYLAEAGRHHDTPVRPSPRPPPSQAGVVVSDMAEKYC
ncbi:recombinase family protein [Mycobacterium sp.]|uniref:recombinase family protein n=1 Tax=Mycobacterium sp. TaxID=1785 RepID=UPI003F9CF3AA